MNEDFIPLLRKGVEWVEEQDRLDPEIREWVQGDWVVSEEERVSVNLHRPECGTGRCLAGFLGMQLNPQAFKDKWEAETEIGWHTVDTYVERKMGIDPFHNGGYLWDGNNDAKSIRRIAENIAGQSL